MNSYNRSDKPDFIPPLSAWLQDHVPERVRYPYHSLQIEKVCVYWTKASLLADGKGR